MELKPIDFNPFEQGGFDQTFPTTAPQREVWTSCQLGTEASLAFNESISLEFQGPLDHEALSFALNQLVLRHQALRGTVSKDGTTFGIKTFVPVVIPLLSLTGSPIQELATLRRQEVATPFDIETGPLFRFKIVQLAPEHHALLLTLHHLICDGWSFGILIHELAIIYAAALKNCLPELPVADAYGQWSLEMLDFINSKNGKETERFWHQRFSQPIRPVQLPYSQTRKGRTFSSHRVELELEKEFILTVRKLSGQMRASTFHTLLSAWSSFLFRQVQLDPENNVQTGDLFAIGIPSAAQATFSKATLVGHCVHLLPIPIECSGKDTFQAWVQQTKKSVLDSMDHAGYTYGQIVQHNPMLRDASGYPTINVQFNVDPGLDLSKIHFPHLQVRFVSHPRIAENFDLFLNAVEYRDRLVFELQYNTMLLQPEIASQLLSSFAHWIQTLAAQPTQTIDSLPLLPPTEFQKIVYDWNRTQTDYPSTMRIEECIEATALQYGESVALADQHRSLTYRRLTQEITQLAALLQQKGVRAGDRVAICLDRTIDYPIAVLATLKCGATYVPIDPYHPAERIQWILADSETCLLVTTRKELHGIEHAWQQEGTPRSIPTLCLDDLPPFSSAIAFQTPLTPAKTAYILYTSGSTGRPKGVCISHQAVVNFIKSMQQQPGLQTQDRLLAITTFAFDISGLELLLPLFTGATCLIATKEVTLDGFELLNTLKKHKITHLQATPATWQMLLAAGWAPGETPWLKAFCGGEGLPRELASQLLARTAELWNLYGPTETTIWSSCVQVTASASPLNAFPITIGRPIANTQLYILDANQNPVPVGVPGELFIAGDGLAEGYWNRPDLTAERFLPNPFVTGTRMYRTGDRARFLPTGEVEHLGRTDFQVKLRGYRIELGEIESRLLLHPSIQQAVVTVREDQPGDQRLTAYLISTATTALTTETVRFFLQTSLPDYMIPSQVVVLEQLPLTPNGKIDRKNLPKPGPSLSPHLSYGEPISTPKAVEPNTTKVTAILHAIWQEVLARPSTIPLDQSFFKIGGHSLLGMQVIGRLERALHIRISLRDFFENPSLAMLVQFITEKIPTNISPQSTILATQSISRHSSSNEPVPLSLMQQRLWFLEQLYPASTAFHLPAAFVLKGPLQLAALTRALQKVVDRQESLRIRIESEGELPALSVQPWTVRLDCESITESELQQRLQLEAQQDLPLEEFPLFRMRLFSLQPQHHVLFFMAHHIVFDGWSFDVLLSELSAFYLEETSGIPTALPALPIQYGDFSAWHHRHIQSPSVQNEIRYWQNNLKAPLDHLELPPDFVRPAEPSFQGKMEEIVVPAPLARQLQKIATERNSTLSMLILASFQWLLQILSRQKEITVGIPIQGRTHPETENLIGFFVNTIAIRTDVAKHTTFGELLQTVREQSIDAYSHQEAPFEMVVDALKISRSLDRSPVFQAFFSYQDTQRRSAQMGPIAVDQIHLHSGGAQTDLTLWVKETGQELRGGLDYNTDLFLPETIRKWFRQWIQLLETIATNPDTTIQTAAKPINPTVLGLEQCLLSHPAIQQAIVVAEAESVYIQTKDGKLITSTDLRQYLRDHHFPEALIPARIFPIENLPLLDATHNDGLTGKNPGLKLAEKIKQWIPFQKAAHSAPVDTTSLLIQIWQEVLAIPEVRPSDRFFSIGGHSLLSLQVIEKIKKATGIRLNPRILLLNNLEQIAAQLTKQLVEELPISTRQPTTKGSG